MARKPFTLESNLKKVIEKIEEKPHKVMNIIGQNIVKETKANLRQTSSTRRGMLISTLGYWARRQEKDIQIGFKMSIVANKFGAGPGIVGDMMTRQIDDPIKPVVEKNKDLIAELIGKALDEIRKE